MLYGTQQLDAFPGKRVDGVFGMWYGKGPGVDRAGDALHCGNFIGTSRHGGVLAVAGDDHGAHSSTYPHQTEHVFQGVFIPVLNPASVADILDLGLAGIALSRFSGLWIALKTTAETAEQAATLIVPSARSFIAPDFVLPPHGLNYDPHLRFPADRAELERRVVMERIPAALAWARANRLDRRVLGGDDAPIGIVTVGRAHADTMHALRMLDLQGHAQIALYKVAMTWPLETEGLRAFARGKRAILVVEEKRSFVESQIRDALYNLPADQRPEISGKTDASGAPLLSPLMELSPEIVAAGLAGFLRSAGLNVAGPAGGAHARAAAGPAAAHSRVLRRMSAWHLDAAAGGQLRHRRHRLPLHGAGRERPDAHVHPNGRRGRAVRRHGAVHRDAARVRQHGRRHVYALGHHGDPPGGRGGHAHHLQAAGQRRGGDDRRAAGGRQLLRRAVCGAGRGGGCGAHRRGGR